MSSREKSDGARDTTRQVPTSPLADGTPRRVDTDGVADLPRTFGNELEFLSFGEFKQMCPTILGLEVTRIGKVMQHTEREVEFHNRLVRTRYAVTQFIDCLGRAEKDTVQDDCADHLRSAIMNLSYLPDHLDAQTKQTCRYILDRLGSVYYRIRLLY